LLTKKYRYDIIIFADALNRGKKSTWEEAGKPNVLSVLRQQNLDN